MAAKGSKKDDTGDSYCAIFVYILPLCGLPKEKIKGKSKDNANKHIDLLHKCREIMWIAMLKRDDWKLAFESRLNSSGFEDMDKIGEFLIQVLKATTDILKGNHLAREHMTLAVYCEFMLFLNYKRIEFDFRQMLDVCKLRSWKQIPENSEGLSVSELFDFTYGLSKIHWIRNLVLQYATPYEKSNVSEMLRMFLLDIKNNLDKIKVRCIDNTQNPTAVLDECFESQDILPGDRDSPELLECSESRIREERKRSGRGSNRTSGWTIKPDIGSRSEVRQRKTSSHLEIKPWGPSRNLGIDQGDHESFNPHECSGSGTLEEREESIRRLTPSTDMKSEVRQIRMSSQPGVEPLETSESNIRRKEKKNRKRSTRSAGIMEHRTENRTRSYSELAIEDRLGQMSLFDDGRSKDKDRKPQGRKSH